jgi:hypothetical protein
LTSSLSILLAPFNLARDIAPVAGMPPVRHLLLCAKLLFVAAILAGCPEITPRVLLTSSVIHWN